MIDALIAGKLAAKIGLFAGAVILLKKVGIFLLLGIAAMWRRFMRLFSTDKMGPQS